MISVDQIITDIKAEFPGSKSFSIDWYNTLKRAADNVIDEINPETMKRRVPIYGGLTRYLQVYYCPSDVEAPTRIYSNDRSLQFDYVPAAYYWSHPYERDNFTIEYVNGVRFIVINHPLSVSGVVLDDMTSVEGKAGAVSLSPDTYNLLPGASIQMRGTFSDTAYTVTRTLDAPIDITAMLQGVTLLPAYVDSAEIISSVTLRLKSDDENYYTVQSTQDSVGDYLTDGQNMIRFWLQNAVKTGAPDPENIVAWELDIPMTAGNSQSVVLGKITIQASQLFTLEYQSNQLFVDGTSKAWKSTPVKGDLANLNRDALGILHYEACLLVVQSATVSKMNPGAQANFQANLTRKYQAYWASHPSSEEPLSYDISPNIPHHPDIFGWELGTGDLANVIGQSTGSVFGPATINFADAETPGGVIDGTNTVFTLLHAPDPAASLFLVLNGQVLTQGVDYHLSGKTITFTTAPAADLAGTPFQAAYRYTSTL